MIDEDRTNQTEKGTETEMAIFVKRRQRWNAHLLGFDDEEGEEGG